MKIIDKIYEFIQNYKMNTGVARYRVQPGVVIPFPAPPVRYRNKLYLQLEGGRIVTQHLQDWEGDDLLAPWNEFVEWYDVGVSPSYLFIADNAAIMVRRKDIQFYQVTLEEC